jgi:uncharacterized protein
LRKYLEMDKFLLKKIIVENEEFIMNLDLISREGNMSLDSEANYVFCGIRRCGKSFLMYQRIQQLLKEKRIEEFVYLNFEDERFIEFNASHFDIILECARELYTKKAVLFFDEIQNIDHWEKFARRIADQGYRIYITGSNAKMISKEIGTTLGGRYFIKDLYPLSFGEFLNFNAIKLEKNFELKEQRFEVKKYFESFFQYGGFPELLKYQNPKEYLSSIFMKVFYGDLIARNHIQNEQILKLLIKKLAESVNNETSINRIKNLITSTGIKLGSNTITEYLNHLFDSYLIFPLNNFASGFAERETKKKYYFIDQGLLNLFLVDQDTKLLENIVFLHLYKKYKDQLYFFKRKLEVDFYVPDQNLLIQACYSLHDPEAKKREINALTAAMNELNIQQATIITYDEDDSIEIGNKQIDIKPVWNWLLNE